MDQTNLRAKDNERDEWQIQLKIHQSNDIAHLYTDKTFFNPNTDPILKLRSLDKYKYYNNEYFVDVTPNIVVTTDAFKKMNIRQRNCKLEQEIEDKSIFKVYTNKNCKYECIIKKAQDLCSCIPWDFIHNTLAHECDIFGRTCFYNAMKNLTMHDDCNHCMKECDYITYDAVVREETFNSRAIITGSYESGKCDRQRAFCDFFLPNNRTKIFDQGVVNAYDRLMPTGYDRSSFNASRIEMLKDMVVVHLKILKPKVQVIDAKYSMLDKFASFGGKFGIFAQITGCSFLGILNFLLLLFKLIFTPRQNQS